MLLSTLCFFLATTGVAQAVAFDGAAPTGFVKRQAAGCAGTVSTTAIVPPPPTLVCGLPGTLSNSAAQLSTTTLYQNVPKASAFASCRSACLGAPLCQAFEFKVDSPYANTGTCSLFSAFSTASFKRTVVNNLDKTEDNWYNRNCFSTTCVGPPQIAISKTTSTTYSTSIINAEPSDIVTTCSQTRTSIVPTPVGIICGVQGTLIGPPAHQTFSTHFLGDFAACRDYAMAGPVLAPPATVTGFAYTSTVVGGMTTADCRLLTSSFPYQSLSADAIGHGSATYFYNTKCFSTSMTCEPVSVTTVFTQDPVEVIMTTTTPLVPTVTTLPPSKGGPP